MEWLVESKKSLYKWLWHFKGAMSVCHKLPQIKIALQTPQQQEPVYY